VSLVAARRSPAHSARETIRDVTARLGLSDVREFGLTWEDCEAYLAGLGYRASVDIVQAR
jgi:hypothetical protein